MWLTSMPKLSEHLETADCRKSSYWCNRRVAKEDNCLSRLPSCLSKSQNLPFSVSWLLVVWPKSTPSEAEGDGPLCGSGCFVWKDAGPPPSPFLILATWLCSSFLLHSSRMFVMASTSFPSSITWFISSSSCRPDVLGSSLANGNRSASESCSCMPRKVPQDAEPAYGLNNLPGFRTFLYRSRGGEFRSPGGELRSRGGQFRCWGGSNSIGSSKRIDDSKSGFMIPHQVTWQLYTELYFWSRFFEVCQEKSLMIFVTSSKKSRTQVIGSSKMSKEILKIIIFHLLFLMLVTTIIVMNKLLVIMV